MAYKLIAVDIDGTLLNSDGILTEETRKAIADCVDHRIVFTISTGRPIQGVRELNRTLNLDCPYITYNGAMVVLGLSGEVLYEQRLSAEHARSILRLGQEWDTTMLVWTDNKLYADRQNERVSQYAQASGTEPVITGNLTDVVTQGVTKILWYDDVESINRYQSLAESRLSDEINCHTSRPFFLEFVDQKASKAIALERIGEYYGIDRREMIAVGDGQNDISMIRYAGLGVAMGNAQPSVKAAADFVTRSNDEDGLAYTIRRFILENEKSVKS
jgi:Cof subfamily protein (haloacid dehalogenase superfamily)